MSAVPHPVQFREARPTTTAAAHDQIELLGELSRLFAIDARMVAVELRPIVEALRARVKVCYRCATETIGRREPKRSQRQFCGRECQTAQAHEDFLARESHAESSR